MRTLITRRQALAATSALALAPFGANAAEPEAVGMQLILAADVSGSVNAARYKTQQEGYLEALGDARVLDVIHELEPPVLAVTFIAWARDQEVMVPWTRVEDAKSMDLFRGRLKNTQRPQIGVNTLISRALSTGSLRAAERLLMFPEMETIIRAFVAFVKSATR
jgi:hypothetical protein